MEHVIIQSLVQAPGLDQYHWYTSGVFWNWAFWIAFIVGIIGAGIFFFMKPTDTP